MIGNRRRVRKRCHSAKTATVKEEAQRPREVPPSKDVPEVRIVQGEVLLEPLIIEKQSNKNVL